MHFAQVPGTIKHSSECRGGTEQLVRSKKLVVPMLIFADHVLPFVAASYILTGRFNPERELEEHPTIEATEAEHKIKRAKAENNDALAEELESDKDQQRDKWSVLPKNGNNIGLRSLNQFLPNLRTRTAH